MALHPKHRSTLYQGLVAVIPDEEAVAEMLSYFPARDVEEPVTKELLRAEMADLRTDLRTEMADLRTDLRTEMADLRTEMADLRGDVRTEMAGLRTEMADLRGDVRSDMERMVRTMQTWMVGTALTVAGLAVAAVSLLR